MRVCILAVALALPVSPASAVALLAYGNTQQLAEYCSTHQTFSDSPDFCSGYILATFDQLTLDGKVCGGYGVTPQQVDATGKKILEDNPQSWSQPPGVILKQVFARVYTCQKAGK
jgi:hypothetical protein